MRLLLSTTRRLDDSKTRRLDDSATRRLDDSSHTIRLVSIIGVDFGGKRIGIAVSDSGVVASPHSVLRNEGDIVEKLDRLGRELEAELFVVGIPERTHASSNDEKFRAFAEALRQKTCKPVELWNESLSTVEAMERLRDSGKSRREAQKDIDMHAAAVILQSYLDDRQRRSS
ncbi:MAG TPA: Holliday junction resolvase RuvX [Thermoanaerobaculia bacterium]|nr:Holliday junction resolvase RuvX [Thermoanaerobaculia bacterium]